MKLAGKIAGVIFFLSCAAVLMFVAMYVDISPDDSSNKPSYKSSTTDESSIFPLDLNKATKEELMKADGIGEAIADSIISYRNKNGRFYSIDELLNINGIGEKKLEALKLLFYVEETPKPTTTETMKPEDAPPSTSADDKATEKPTTTTTVVTTAVKTTTSAKTTTAATTTEPPQRQFVNVNSASAEEISRCLLISLEDAEAIVYVRDLIGGFKTPDGIINVCREGDFSNFVFTFEEYNRFKDYVLVD